MWILNRQYFSSLYLDIIFTRNLYCKRSVIKLWSCNPPSRLQKKEVSLFLVVLIYWLLQLAKITLIVHFEFIKIASCYVHVIKMFKDRGKRINETCICR